MHIQSHAEIPEEQPLLEPSAIVECDFGEDEARRELERSLLKKLDKRMSILVIIYILNYVDRNNVSAARLRGFEEDLGLEGTQFASILSILYIGYILMQVPSNMFLQRLGKPSIYLPICMSLWGFLSIATGFTNSFLGALITRFLLGFVEAAFFPGALFLISKWYKRSELSRRTALLACGILISNAFGSLIAAGILDSMDGILGFAAWRWLFFVEGSLTVVVAFSAIFILPDFPETTSGWLSHSEKALAQRRMLEDANFQTNTDKSDIWHGLSMAFADYKVWWLAISLTFIVVSLSFGVYFPTLCATMGYSPTVSLLLCVPPWLCATFLAFMVSRSSDHNEERCMHIVGPLLLGIFGLMLSRFTTNFSIRYLALFFMAQAYGGYICFLAWASGSVSETPAKRAVALAIINCIANLGNAVGSYAWPSTWGPNYSMSYVICILAAGIAIFMVLSLRAHFLNLNSAMHRMEVDRGQRKPGYRYML